MDTQTNGQVNIPAPTQAPAPQPPQSGSSNTGMAILSYLSILVIIPLISEAKNDPFVKFHIKQGLVLLIGEIIGFILMHVPIIGLIMVILQFGFLVLIVLGVINAANGQEKELPLIGQFAKSFNF